MPSTGQTNADDARHVSDAHASRSQDEAVATAAALVAADDGHVQHFLDHLSPHMHTMNLTLSSRAHTELPLQAQAMSSFATGSLIDIPAAPDADFPLPDQGGGGSGLYLSKPGLKSDLALSPAAADNMRNGSSTQERGMYAQ